MTYKEAAYGMIRTNALLWVMLGAIVAVDHATAPVAVSLAVFNAVWFSYSFVCIMGSADPRNWFFRENAYVFYCAGVLPSEMREWCKTQLHHGWHVANTGFVYLRREQDAALFLMFFNDRVMYRQDPTPSSNHFG